MVIFRSLAFLKNPLSGNVDFPGLFGDFDRARRADRFDLVPLNDNDRCRQGRASVSVNERPADEGDDDGLLLFFFFLRGRGQEGDQDAGQKQKENLAPAVHFFLLSQHCKGLLYSIPDPIVNCDEPHRKNGIARSAATRQSDETHRKNGAFALKCLENRLLF
jgi:hypothetical protein